MCSTLAWSPILLILVSNDDESVEYDDVNVFNEDKSLWEPLRIPVPPNICSEPLINPLGIDVIST